MNLPDNSYNTKSESNYVREFLQKHKNILNMSNLSRRCGMDRTKLVRISQPNSKETIHPKKLKTLSKILNELNFELPQRITTIKDIQRKISKKSGVSLNDMRRKHTKRFITEERQIIMFLCKKFIKPIYLKDIGFYFNRTKENVWASIYTVEKDIQTNIRIRKKVEGYEKLFIQ